MNQLEVQETGELGPLDLAEQLNALGVLRLQEAELAVLVRDAKFNIQPLLDQHSQIKSLAEKVRADLCVLAVNNFIATGEKPHKAITIRYVKQIVFDAEETLQWALTNGRFDLLTLNEVEVKRQAIGLQAVGAPVTVFDAPQAAIASNLAPWMAPIGL